MDKEAKANAPPPPLDKSILYITTDIIAIKIIGLEPIVIPKGFDEALKPRTKRTTHPIKTLMDDEYIVYTQILRFGGCIFIFSCCFFSKVSSRTTSGSIYH